MYNETSLYIKNDLLEKLDDAALKLDLSRSRLVSILLVKYMEENQAGDKAFLTLKYQRGDAGIKFKTKNLCLRKDIYEKWCDVRKLFKVSASFAIALSIEKYLDEIVNGKTLPYNYFSMYLTNTIYADKACIHITVLGIAPEKTLKKILEIEETGET